MGETAILGNAPLLLNLEAATEEEVIRQMIRTLAERVEVLDSERLEVAVMERQKLQPPLLGNGVALPHARTSAVSEIVLAIGRCKEPVLFGPEEAPVRLVFLYGVPAHSISGYLAAVAQLTRMLRKPGVLANLLAAEDEATFREILK
jgi:mannitol/fructose-specific phosphotransferase system IIA component (Ntr-type)